MGSKAQLYKRNYLLLVLEGACFMGALGFFSANTVVPVFINHMTGSKLLVGITISVGSFLTYLGRLAVGPFVSHMRNHAKYTTLVLFLTRPVTLLPGILLLLNLPSAALVALMIGYWFLWAADGLVVPTWSEVMATTVDEHRHGRLLGTQQLLGGVLAIGAGVLVTRFLSIPTMNMNRAFAFVFLCGGVLMVLSCIFMASAEGAPHTPKAGKVDILGYYRELPRHFVREKDNSKVLVLQLMMSFGMMCLPFIILFAGETEGVPEGLPAMLVLVQTIGLPIGGWMWGQICDHISITFGLKMAALNVLLLAALPLLVVALAGSAPWLLASLLVLTMLLGGVSGGVWTMSFLYTVQAVKPEDRASCIVLSSLVAMPASFASALAGFITQQFGYAPLFVLCVLLSLVTLGMSFRIRPVSVVVKEREQAEREAQAQAVAGEA